MSNTDESSDHPTDDQNKSSRARLRSNSYDQAISSDNPEVNKSSPEPPKQPLPEPPKKSSENDSHIIKWIEFNHERLPILLQNMNGPCPLVALANILLLRKQVRFLFEKYFEELYFI
jgi:hypothetical protein